MSSFDHPVGLAEAEYDSQESDCARRYATDLSDEKLELIVWKGAACWRELEWRTWSWFRREVNGRLLVREVATLDESLFRREMNL